MENQTEKPKIAWEQFEKNNEGGTFLILQDKETKTIGIKSIKQAMANFERKQKDGTQKMTEVPQIHLVLDSVDGQKCDMVFPTGAKYLIAYIKNYHDNGMLYTYYFAISRSGIGMATKYMLAPTILRPKL